MRSDGGGDPKIPLTDTIRAPRLPVLGKKEKARHS
jgi:hypothetical protein